MNTALAVLAALALDAWLGEPHHLHPLVGFGRLAQALERRIHADSIVRGALALVALLTPFIVLATLTRWLPSGTALGVLLLYLALGWNSLASHARAVREALLEDDLALARRRVGAIVSRDTAALDRQGVVGATLESVLENGNDAIFGAIFWFVVAGAPGVVLYRLANTLDAMWGYRNERYLRFGRAAARLDDALNFVPARLTALGYAMAGRSYAALRCWHRQGTRWKSPNAGPVMAAGAGSLGVLLGGPANYHGVAQTRPPLGEGHPPDTGDIDNALRLIRHTLLVCLLLVFAGGGVVDYVMVH